MPTLTVPERIAWAVETMRVAPGNRLLEIGCGRGVAVARVCERLNGGTILAIDRSAVAIGAARTRNADEVASGKASFQTAALAEADLSEARFDKVFAVNVNLFWTGSAKAELERIRYSLAPAGTLFVFYEPPGGGTSRLADRVGAALTAAGFAVSVVNGTTGGGSSLVGIVGRIA